MSVFQPSRRVFGLFAVAILASGIAAADTIEVTGLGLGDSNLWIKENGTNTDVDFTGIIDIQLIDPTGTYNRTTMCVQLFINISENVVYNTTVLLPSQVTVVPPPTVAALEQVGWLLDNEAPTTNNAAAGLQLAIWKIAEDGVDTGSNLSWTTGTVQEATGTHTTTAAVLTAATSYLTASVGHSSDLAFVYENSTQATPPVSQQMLEGLEYSTGPQPSTPESSTFVLAGVALLALGHTARRKLGSR
ncbi:MAG: hypothetical protein ABSE42_12450 [Bryobacteraceae bacterium]|jgi:hypothetical protein